MGANLLGPAVEVGFIDKRRSAGGKAAADSSTHITTNLILATANGAGSTSTIVYANATPATGVNTMRIGDSFRLFTAAGVVKEETVFRVTAIVVAGSTTATFTPLAGVATANTDVAKLVGVDAIEDEDSLDAALATINGGNSYTAARLRQMTQNDKIWAVRQEIDPSSV